MNANPCSLTVMVNGRPVREYLHEGKTFIEGRQGSDFELVVRNNSNKRVMAVLSVDGLSVINGTTASQDSPGYVLGPYQSITIPGWKLTNDEAAKFTFSGKKDSYTQMSTGSAKNCGVLGVLSWSEKVPVPVAVLPPAFANLNTTASPFYGNVSGSTGTTSPYLKSMASSAPMPQANSKAAQRRVDITAKAEATSLNNIGTEFGDATQFKTQATTFERDAILGVAAMYYDDARGLKARGIVVETPSRDRYSTTPDAFPGMNCSPPKGWQG